MKTTPRTARSARLAGLALAATLLLAACTVEISTPDARSVETLASGEDYRDVMTPIRVNLAAGESRSFTFDYSSGRADAVYAVVSAGDLYLETLGGRVEASSSVSTYFAAGTDGIIELAVRADEVDVAEVPPGNVSDTVECIGACIIVRDEASSPIRFTDKRIVISNPFEDARNIDLYVFSRNLDDVSEPTNDSMGGADLIDDLDSRFGALETLGDVDFFELDFRGDVTVDAPTVPLDDPFPEDYLRIRAAWIDARGDEVQSIRIDPDGSAEFTDMPAGAFIKIEAVDDRAGPAEGSLYKIAPSGIVGMSYPSSD